MPKILKQVRYAKPTGGKPVYIVRRGTTLMPLDCKAFMREICSRAMKIKGQQ